MDVFKIDQSLSGNIGNAPSPDKINASDVSFDAGTEFNLCFFDTTPEDSSTAGGYSDPGSVGSTTNSSPPPPPQQKLAPLHIPPLNGNSAGSTTVPSPVLLSPPGAGATTSTITIKQEHYVAADSNSSSTTKSFVPCKVCGDKASGYHYGVTSCEGCKGFFRRSIQKQIEYRCLRDGKCLVIRLNRNRCQYCRFKKCLAVGMSRDSVRYGRVPKRSRERSTDEASQVTTSDADQSSDSADTKQLAVYDIILTISQAHHANCGYTEEHTRNLVRKPIILPPASPDESTGDSDMQVASSTAESLEKEKCWLYQQFASNVTPSVQRVVEFAKRVPGFCDLGQDDQLILIKLGFFEVWLSHAARLMSNTSMMFDDGTVFTRQQLDTMFDNDFAASLVHFATTFNSLALNDAEIGLFSAVVLLTTDRAGITDVKSIEHYQDKLVEALKVQVNRNHSNDPQTFTTLLNKVTELKNIGAKHFAHLEWFRINWKRISLPPLFAEIFDIPKTEDDLH